MPTDVTAAQRTESVYITDSAGNTVSVTANRLVVDGSGVTQPVSGTVSITANSSINLAQVGGTNVVSGGVAGSQGVGGLAAAGSAIAGNPVLIGGSDGTNARALLTDSSGQLIVSNIADTATVTTGTMSSVTTSASLALEGHTSISLVSNPSAATLTWCLQVSADGGATWTGNGTPIPYFRVNNAALNSLQNSVPLSGSSAQIRYVVWVPGGSTHIRASVSAYTSGSIFFNISATNVPDFAPALAYIAPGQTAPITALQVGGVDPSGIMRALPLGTSGQSVTVQGYQSAATTFSGITGTGNQASTSVSGLNVATVTLRTFTGTTPSITWKLQGSDDNSNWVDLQGINNSTGQVSISFTQAAALSAGTGGPSIDYSIGAYTNVRINVSAISGTSATAAFGLGLQSMPYEASPGALCQGLAATGVAVVGNPVLVAGSDGTNARSLSTDSSGRAIVSLVDGQRATYRCAVVAFTPIASATAPTFSITGSASKTVRILRIRVSASASTGGIADLSVKRYSAMSSGTAASQSANIAKMDSGNAAATAVVNIWSAAATVTAAGIVVAERYEIITPAVTVLPQYIEWTFGDGPGQSLVLRGTSEFAGLLFSSIATTPIADAWVEWTEE